jgi:hypothetical protein
VNLLDKILYEYALRGKCNPLFSTVSSVSYLSNCYYAECHYEYVLDIYAEYYIREYVN